jgi:hypothetical protein
MNEIVNKQGSYLTKTVPNLFLSNPVLRAEQHEFP